MTDWIDVRDEIARAITEDSGDQPPVAVLAAVMAIVDPIVAERGEARLALMHEEQKSAMAATAHSQESQQWMANADQADEAYDEIAERCSEAEDRADALSSMLRGMARRVREVRDGVRGPWHPNWHSAWRSERESRFWWAEEAARLEAELETRFTTVVHQCCEEVQALRASAVVLPGDWQAQLIECHDQQDAIALIESWRPATAEAAPLADLPEPEWRRFHSDVTSARAPSPPVDRGTLAKIAHGEHRDISTRIQDIPSPWQAVEDALDRLISAGLVRTPVTAEQIETCARELHRRDLGDVDAWLHEPEHRRDMWRSKARTAAKALGLSVAQGGDHVAG